jgi:uncharacterized protein YceH (UPF0502 family)
MHLFSGQVDLEEYAVQAQAVKQTRSTDRVSVAELATRVSELEADVARLKKLLE